jgi:hypothetical protein
LLGFLYRQANALMVPVSQQRFMTYAGATALYGHAVDKFFKINWRKT